MVSEEYKWVNCEMSLFCTNEKVKTDWMEDGSLLVKVVYNIIFKALVSRG